jgi:hypothetical protein
MATLRLTSGGNVNAEFLMLVPAPPVFKVTATVASGQITLSFPTETGHTYTVVYKSTLNAPSWTPLGSAVNGTGSTVTVSETISGSAGFYTVTVQ